MDRVVGLGARRRRLPAQALRAARVAGALQTMLRRVAPAPRRAGDCASTACADRPDRRSVQRQGEAVDLTGTEFELLAAGRATPAPCSQRDDILNRLRGHAGRGHPHARGRHPRQPAAPQARAAGLHQDAAQRRLHLRQGAREGRDGTAFLEPKCAAPALAHALVALVTAVPAAGAGHHGGVPCSACSALQSGWQALGAHRRRLRGAAWRPRSAAADRARQAIVARLPLTSASTARWSAALRLEHPAASAPPDASRATKWRPPGGPGACTTADGHRIPSAWPCLARGSARPGSAGSRWAAAAAH